MYKLMLNNSKTIIASAVLITLSVPSITLAANRSIPSVVVTVENSAPSRGAVQTPFWLGIHDGTFDLYDRGVALGTAPLVAAPAMESIAEDGNTGPLSEQFSLLLPNAPQTTLIGPAGPFTPGTSSSFTFNVNPETDRYFSYASMLVPSNDAFIANGSPIAHPLFSASGQFIAEDFVVTGSEVLDAGTEVNDEISSNTAFLNQGGPNIGVTENGVVVDHPGFQTGLSFPDGVLNYPIFGNANFLAPNYRTANIKFQYIDLGARNFFTSSLSSNQEVSAELVASNGVGRAVALSRNAEEVFIRIRFRGLSGAATKAHLHNAAQGSNGPLVVDMTDKISSNGVYAVIRASDVTGPLASGADPLLSLLNELAAGNIYINIHTEANPDGEIRGQVALY